LNPIRLDVDTGAEQANYLDLVRRGPLNAVVENGGSPLLYLVDAVTPLAASDRDDLRRRLANRSDPAWLGVVRAGTLEVFPVGFKAQSEPTVTLDAADPRAPLLFQGLVHGAWAPEIATDTVYHRIFELLNETLEYLAPPGCDGRGTEAASRWPSQRGSSRAPKARGPRRGRPSWRRSP